MTPGHGIGRRASASLVLLLNMLIILVALVAPSSTANLAEDFDVSSNAQILRGGELLKLSLDQLSASGFSSKSRYLFGNIDMQIKLVPGDSAGTVTAYYLSSSTSDHDELDFEFLGNLSGQPYVLQTNVFASGIGGREQRIYLWFDPTTDFHTYSVSWTTQRIIFLVDGIPIRAFANNEAQGIPYPNRQPMALFGSIWNGDSWATQGGRIKINWQHAPFITSFRNFEADACVFTGSISACSASNTAGNQGSPSLAADEVQKLRWVEQNYMIYNYCTDTTRYPVPPVDCSST
eukprot:c29081_g1_i1 orf=351-1223(+)